MLHISAAKVIPGVLLATAGYAVRTIQDVVTTPATGVNWTLIIVTGIGAVQIVILEVLRRKQNTTQAKLVKTDEKVEHVKELVNSTASTLEKEAARRDAEGVAKDVAIRTLEIEKSRLQERLASLGTQVVPAAAPVSTAAETPLPVKVVAAVPVPVKETPDAKTEPQP